MSESSESSSRMTGDIAMARFRAYLANRREDDRLQEEARETIPGYSEVLESAKISLVKSGGGGIAIDVAAFAPEMAIVDRKFEGQREERETERDAVAAAFALLDESAIRQLLAAPSQTAMERDMEFPFVARMLVRSCNPNAVVPLMDRLQNDVEDFLLDGVNHFWRFVNETINRDSLRTTRELHRDNDRSQTLRALGCLGDRRAEPAIRPFLDDTNEHIRQAARRAMDEIDKANVAD